MTQPMTQPMTLRLTRNQQLVLDVLSGSKGPVSAYAILDDLRPAGLKAPLQVYRALDKLIETGLAHRIESMNAFVACNAPDDDHDHESLVFMLCNQCGDVAEFADHALSHRLDTLCHEHHFKAEKQTIEIRGLCRDCGE